MVTVSRFEGLTIVFQWNEEGRPHFHVHYQGKRCSYYIESGYIRGELPANKRRLLHRWVKLHKKELLLNWDLRANSADVRKIDPLR